MAIVIRNLSKAFDGKAVLTDFCAEIRKNALTCIMGESGCGKTTLLSLIAGRITPDSGTISGVPYGTNGKIAAVFQENRLAEAFTVYRNLRMVCTGSKPSADTLCEMLARVGMEKDVLYSPVSALSGGMKRRVAILRALLCDSPLMLMDEPTSGLDAENKKAVIAFIREKTKNKTVLWVTHDKAEAETADAILYL